MAKKMKMSKIAGLIAGFGLFVALILGLLEGFNIWTAPILTPTVLVILGIMIALFNISTKESTSFLIAVLVIVIGSGTLATLPFAGNVIEVVFNNIATILVPAGTLIALIMGYKMARN